MISTIKHKEKQFKVDLSKPFDISIPIKSGNSLSAWYVSPPKITPVVGDGFIGSVKKGGNVNFRDIRFNPHGHGTHTECVGHISPEVHSINTALKKFHFLALLITVEPTNCKKIEGTRQLNDKIITLEHLKEEVDKHKPEAIIIRTLPNEKDKLTKKYSNTNPPYLCDKAAAYLAKNNVKHLLIDLPSVDKEVDNGELKAHKAFWQYPEKIRLDSTITEFIFVPNEIADGLYLLNLQIASFVNDASPSKPVLYKITPYEH